MKTLFTKVTLCLLISGPITTTFAGESEMTMLTPGLYAGIGGSWNTIDESFGSTLITSNGRSGRDNFDMSHSRLAPMVQIGYWRPLCQGWLWGVAAQWKYLNYVTPNDDATRGEHLPNASFSSINIFGANITRDFSAQTRVNNEVAFLLYIGKQLQNGYAYLGMGPVLFTAANSLYVFSVHKANGIGANLVSNSVTNKKTIWGGMVQVGYNYYLNPTFFLNFNYSYSQTATNEFNNSINTAIFNGFATPGPITLNLNRSVNLKVQEVMFSINKVFEI